MLDVKASLCASEVDRQLMRVGFKSMLSCLNMAKLEFVDSWSLTKTHSTVNWSKKCYGNQHMCCDHFAYTPYEICMKC